MFDVVRRTVKNEIQMSDFKLTSLLKRIEEKLDDGYDMMKKVELIHDGLNSRWVAVMKKVEGV